MIYRKDGFLLWRSGLFVGNSKGMSVSTFEAPSENQVSPDGATEVQDLLDYNLSLTYDERALNHQRALDTINELKKARKQIYGELEFHSETPS